MKHEPGTLNLSTLSQSDYWVDRHGNERPLTEMPADYLSSVLGFLRARTARLYQLEITRQEMSPIAAVTDGWDNGVDAIAPHQSPEAAAAWLENTPLVLAIRALLGEPVR
jgi:hypothetical protein